MHSLKISPTHYPPSPPAAPKGGGLRQSIQKVHRAALYFAKGHCVHNSPRTPENPALHVQAAALSLACAASEFDGQLSHTFDVAPTAVEYWPAKQ